MASCAHDSDDSPLGATLLGDIKEIFKGKDADKIASKEVCDGLAKLEDRPWGDYGKTQKPISQNQLARLLKPFGIASHTIRITDGPTAKGYERKDFEDAWARYWPDPPAADPPISDTNLPVSGDPKRHNVTTAGGVRQAGDFQNVTLKPCDGSKNDISPHGEKGCGSVSLQSAPEASPEAPAPDREEF